MSRLTDKVRQQIWSNKAMIQRDEAERLVARLAMIFLKKGQEIYIKSQRKKINV